MLVVFSVLVCMYGNVIDFFVILRSLFSNSVLYLFEILCVSAADLTFHTYEPACDVHLCVSE